MANRTFYFFQSLDQVPILLVGSFAPNGSSAIDSTLNKGRGYTVARTGVGAFLVTLTDSYPYLLAANATLQLATAADKEAQIGAVGKDARGNILNFVVRIWDKSDAALADVAADANNRINFTLTLNNTTYP